TRTRSTARSISRGGWMSIGDARERGVDRARRRALLPPPSTCSSLPRARAPLAALADARRPSRADAVLPTQRFGDEADERADLRAHEPPRRVQHPELGSPVRHGAPDHEAALGRRVRDDAT